MKKVALLLLILIVSCIAIFAQDEDEEDCETEIDSRSVEMPVTRCFTTTVPDRYACEVALDERFFEHFVTYIDLELSKAGTISTWKLHNPTSLQEFPISCNSWSMVGLDKLVGKTLNDIESITNAYKGENQKERLETECGLNGLGFQILSPYYMFDRGHLTPSANYQNRQTTYHYFNAAPQWHPYNIGNWKLIENWIRGMRGQIKNVITGVYGELTCANDANKKLALWYGKTGKSVNIKIPIPQLFYKCIYFKSGEKLYFGTMNHPVAHHQHYYRCLASDICNLIFDILTYYNLKDPSRGLTECCDATKLNIC